MCCANRASEYPVNRFRQEAACNTCNSDMLPHLFRIREFFCQKVAPRNNISHNLRGNRTIPMPSMLKCAVSPRCNGSSDAVLPSERVSFPQGCSAAFGSSVFSSFISWRQDSCFSLVISPIREKSFSFTMSQEGRCMSSTFPDIPCPDIDYQFSRTSSMTFQISESVTGAAFSSACPYSPCRIHSS